MSKVFVLYYSSYGLHSRVPSATAAARTADAGELPSTKPNGINLQRASRLRWRDHGERKGPAAPTRVRSA